MIHATAPTTPRQRKREETYERILKAAIDGLSREGLDSLTMQHLAAELGFAVGALYRYFPSKGALLVAIQTRLVATIEEELRLALARVEAHLARSKAVPARQAALLRLWVMVELYRSLAWRRPAEFGLLSMTVGDPRQLVQDSDAGLLVPVLFSLQQLSAGLIGGAVAEGALEPGDPNLRTLVLWTSIHGALQLRKLDRFALGGVDSTAVFDDAVVTLLRGWGADAADLRAARRRSSRIVEADHMKQTAASRTQ